MLIIKACTNDTYQVRPNNNIKLNLNSITKKYKTILKSPTLVIVKVNGSEVTVFKDKILVKGCKTKKQALDIGNILYKNEG